MDTQLVPQDSTQAPTLQEEMHRRQLQLAREVQHAALTVEAEQTLHHKLLLELESYAKTLEDWVNQPGRSPAQQQYVQALAGEFRDTFTRTVLDWRDLTTRRLTERMTKGPPEQAPVIDVSPLPPPPSSRLARVWDALTGDDP